MRPSDGTGALARTSVVPQLGRQLHSPAPIGERERVRGHERVSIRTNDIPLAPDRVAEKMDANRATVGRRFDRCSDQRSRAKHRTERRDS
jgi:hypothetical protein